MDAAIRSLIEALHQRNRKIVLAMTGGGAGAAGLILSVPGGSRTILEIHVPYHDNSLVDFLGSPPEHYCSVETARNMARRAYDRGRWLIPVGEVVGVGATASLATDRPKKGPHRFHLAVQTIDQVLIYSLELTKGARDRETEEAVLDAVLLNALAEAVGLTPTLVPPLLAGEEIHRQQLTFSSPLARFFCGEEKNICVQVDGRIGPGDNAPKLLLPGAFNPFHTGHWKMAEAASRLTGLPPAFELCVANVDKPPLSPAEILHRIEQFSWRAPLWLTRAPIFVEKSLLFPGCLFVVGVDTAMRILDPKYYNNSEEQMLRALEQIRSRRGRFLVAGRADTQGQLVRLANLSVPAAFQDLFGEIPEAEFRFDISSTRIRAQSGSLSFRTDSG
jgi:hypothetical protein